MHRKKWNIENRLHVILILSNTHSRERNKCAMLYTKLGSLIVLSSLKHGSDGLIHVRNQVVMLIMVVGRKFDKTMT